MDSTSSPRLYFLEVESILHVVIVGWGMSNDASLLDFTERFLYYEAEQREESAICLPLSRANHVGALAQEPTTFSTLSRIVMGLRAILPPSKNEEETGDA